VLLLVLDVVSHSVCAALSGTHRVHWVTGWLHSGRKWEGYVEQQRQLLTCTQLRERWVQELPV